MCLWCIIAIAARALSRAVAQRPHRLQPLQHAGTGEEEQHLLFGLQADVGTALGLTDEIQGHLEQVAADQAGHPPHHRIGHQRRQQLELDYVLGHIIGERVHHLAQRLAHGRRRAMQLAHADDEGLGVVGDEVEEQVHRLMAHALAAPQVDAHQLGHGPVLALHRARRRFTAQVTQGLAQLGGDVADHRQAQVVHVLEMAIEGIGVEPRLPRQLAQAEVAQAAALGGQAQGRLHQQALARCIDCSFLGLLPVVQHRTHG